MFLGSRNKVEIDIPRTLQTIICPVNCSHNQVQRENLFRNEGKSKKQQRNIIELLVRSTDVHIESIGANAGPDSLYGAPCAARCCKHASQTGILSRVRALARSSEE